MPRKVKTPDQTPGLVSCMLQDYLKYIVKTKGGSPNTRKSYKTSYRLLANYLWEEKHVSIEKISFSMLDISTLEGFLDWLADTRGNAFNTINNRLAAISAFSKYAVKHNFDAAAKFQKEVSNIERKRGKERDRSHFTVPEVKIILDSPKLNTISGRRDSVILVFMYATAARGQEVCDLRVRDLEFMPDGRCRVTLHGKGGKKRRVTVAADVAKALMKYMKYRKIQDIPDSFVFRTQREPKMSVGCLEQIFDKYVTQAREQHPDLFHEPGYSPHSMRHTTAICMVEAGVPLPVIKVFLGHSTIAATEIYAKITQPSLEKTIEEWNKTFWAHVVDEAKDNAQQEGDDEEKNEDDHIPDFLR